MPNPPKANKRKYIRFPADDNTLGMLTYTIDNVPKSKIVQVYDESRSGCSVLLVGAVPFKKGTKIKIKTGVLDNRSANIRWFSKIAKNIYKIGIAYSQ